METFGDELRWIEMGSDDTLVLVFVVVVAAVVVVVFFFVLFMFGVDYFCLFCL